MNTPDEQRRSLQAELSPSSPKIRLTLVAYLLEYCAPDVEATNETLEFLDMLHQFVVEGYDEYMELLEDIFDDEQVTIIEDDERDMPGYM